MCLIGAEELNRALADAIAVAQEHQGEPIAERMARFGFEAGAVARVAAERWATYRPEFEGEGAEAAFTRAFVEALIAARRLPVCA